MGLDVAIRIQVHRELDQEITNAITQSEETTHQLKGLQNHFRQCWKCNDNHNPAGCVEFRVALKKLAQEPQVPFPRYLRRWIRRGFRIRQAFQFLDPVPYIKTW